MLKSFRKSFYRDSNGSLRRLPTQVSMSQRAAYFDHHLGGTGFTDQLKDVPSSLRGMTWDRSTVIYELGEYQYEEKHGISRFEQALQNKQSHNA